MYIEFHVWLFKIILQVFETNEQTQNSVMDTEKTNVNSLQLYLIWDYDGQKSRIFS